MNFTFLVIKNGKVIDRCQTHSKRRFYNRMGTINWKDKSLRVYLRIYYGRYENVWGKLSDFYNDGEYDGKEELGFALNAFAKEKV